MSSNIINNFLNNILNELVEIKISDEDIDAVYDELIFGNVSKQALNTNRVSKTQIKYSYHQIKHNTKKIKYSHITG